MQDFTFSNTADSQTKQSSDCIYNNECFEQVRNGGYCNMNCQWYMKEGK